VPFPNGVHGEREESLDVEWAHAIAPGAKIDLVECNSSSLSDYFRGVVTASRREWHGEPAGFC
jgi:subtilase family serine protease